MPCFGEDREQQELSSTAGDDVKLYKCFGKQLGNLL